MIHLSGRRPDAVPRTQDGVRVRGAERVPARAAIGGALLRVRGVAPRPQLDRELARVPQVRRRHRVWNLQVCQDKINARRGYVDGRVYVP